MAVIPGHKVGVFGGLLVRHRLRGHSLGDIHQPRQQVTLLENSGQQLRCGEHDTVQQHGADLVMQQVVERKLHKQFQTLLQHFALENLLVAGVPRRAHERPQHLDNLEAGKAKRRVKFSVRRELRLQVLPLRQQARQFGDVLCHPLNC